MNGALNDVLVKGKNLLTTTKGKMLVAATTVSTALPVFASETGSSSSVTVSEIKTNLVDPIMAQIPMSVIFGLMALGITAPLGIWLAMTFGKTIVNKIVGVIKGGDISA